MDRMQIREARLAEIVRVDDNKIYLRNHIGHDVLLRKKETASRYKQNRYIQGRWQTTWIRLIQSAIEF